MAFREAQAAIESFQNPGCIFTSCTSVRKAPPEPQLREYLVHQTFLKMSFKVLLVVELQETAQVNLSEEVETTARLGVSKHQGP